MDKPHVITSDRDRVPWHQLAAYGTGGLIPIALFNIAPQLMSLLGNITLGLSPLWLGAITAIPRLWDAVSDPVMGHISDNTRTPWGRRRPYLLLGGLLVAASFMAMWWVPRGENLRLLIAGVALHIGADEATANAAYNWFQLTCILGAMMVFFTATTIFEIPHGALGMSMSGDYHERTRLFSAKSFLGNLFAMGNSWLIVLAGLTIFRGVGGDLVDGMRYVSMMIAAVLVPLSIWWFVSLREPDFVVANVQEKSKFWDDMRTTITNRTFLCLIGIIFTLSMGFNFVQIFNYYITIYYLYGGNIEASKSLLGWGGTVWAVTGLLAVFPLNWISQRIGKNRTLIVAIGLMCGAQLSKIVCYNPTYPFLALIPTALLSGGMLMFFTLGSSMVGDVCDEDELRTGTRVDGSYYSVFWWFIKMGSALASFVMGALLLGTSFDNVQSLHVEKLSGTIAVIQTEAEKWKEEATATRLRAAELREQAVAGRRHAKSLRQHLADRRSSSPDERDHVQRLIDYTTRTQVSFRSIENRAAELAGEPEQLIAEAELLNDHLVELRQQTPTTLFRLRLFEIGVPLALSVVSVLLVWRYPLTEARCYQIKAELERRRRQLTGG